MARPRPAVLDAPHADAPWPSVPLDLDDEPPQEERPGEDPCADLGLLPFTALAGALPAA